MTNFYLIHAVELVSQWLKSHIITRSCPHRSQDTSWHLLHGKSTTTRSKFDIYSKPRNYIVDWWGHRLKKKTVAVAWRRSWREEYEKVWSWGWVVHHVDISHWAESKTILWPLQWAFGSAISMFFFFQWQPWEEKAWNKEIWRILLM